MYESPDALCPFYKRHDGKGIYCENKNNVKTENIQETNEIIKKICSSDEWKECPIAIICLGKYRK